MSVIGIPRALYYFQYYPLWTRYLTELGFEVVFSPPTTEEILKNGLLTCVDGACLPLKAYVGHALALSEAGVETIFVPELISVWKREYICTSFLGLPDLLRQYLPITTDLLRPTIDGRRGQRALSRDYIRFGREYASFRKVNQAWKRAKEEQRFFESESLPNLQEGKITLLLLGPRYLTDDPFLNGNLKKLLTELGAQVITANIPSDQLAHEANFELKKPFFWTGARKYVGALSYFYGQINGVVNLLPFPCGAQSLFSIVLEQSLWARDLPSLNLVLDEHTSELGMITRLEAFCDLLERRKVL